MPNIKLKFKVQEPASFFHLLDSISQWDIHTRIRIREYYEEKVGISEEDEEYIKRYIKIRKKYSWSLLDSDFIPAKDFIEVKKNLKKRLTKKELLEMNEVINHFYPSIHKIYLEWYKLLKTRKKYLEKEVDRFNINGALGEIKSFYNSKYSSNVIYVHLVVTPYKHNSGGGANIFPNIHIHIEPLNLSDDENLHTTDRDLNYSTNNSLRLVIHEALHLIESGVPKRKWNEFKKRVENKKLNFNIFREAIAETMVPDGFLSQKYSLGPQNILKYKNSKLPKDDNRKSLHYATIRKLAAHIYLLTKEKFEEESSMFEGSYIDDCIKEFQKIQKNIRR